MQSLAFMSPILPGERERFRRFAQQIAGTRQKEMNESRQALGVTRESTWVQSSPMGDILLVYLEGADVLKANRDFASSQSPFDLWFKQEAQGFTGIDFGQPLPSNISEVLFETPLVGHKPSIAVALPVAPGKTEELRRWAQDQYGSRRNDFQDFLRRAGISRACVYLAHTPQGDFAIQYSEGDNPAGAYQYFATSQHAYDRWNREQLAAIHGIDFSQPLPGLPEPGFDYQPSDMSSVMRKGIAQERRTDQGMNATGT